MNNTWRYTIYLSEGFYEKEKEKEVSQVFKLADGRQNVYQWDINVKLLLDESNESADEVHFSARFSRISLSVEVVHTEDSSYVTIPNILLQKPNDIIAYSYITNADGSYTKYDTIIPVIARPKPSGYVYEETEILTWKTLDDKIDDLREISSDAVKYTEQELTDEQKIQARTNIGAVSVDEVPEQVQGDWLQNDNTASDFVKNRTHYSGLQFIEKAHYGSLSQYQYTEANLVNLSPICIEINGTFHTDLYGDTLYGDTDSSVWENGGGMGFYIERVSNRYNIYIDTNRYGPIKDATINLYSQTVEKVLPYYYLPVATGNTIGGVCAETGGNTSGYVPCIIDDTGELYSKEYNAAKIYSELSLANLIATTAYAGDHGLFTDSIAEEFQSYGLTLPVHAWFIGYNFSAYAFKYILESANGITMLVEVKNSNIYSTSVLVTPYPVDYVLNSSTEGSTKRFRITVDDSGTLSATEVIE